MTILRPLTLFVLFFLSNGVTSQVTINGKEMSEDQITELESYIGEAIKTGDYWYDGEFWGYQGSEVMQQKFDVSREVMEQKTVLKIISNFPK